MKNKFKSVIVALMLLGLAYSLPVRSDAGINDINQSIKKNRIYNNDLKKNLPIAKPSKPKLYSTEIEKLEDLSQKAPQMIFFYDQKFIFNNKTTVVTVPYITKWHVIEAQKHQNTKKQQPKRITGAKRAEERAPYILTPYPEMLMHQTTDKIELDCRAKIKELYETVVELSIFMNSTDPNSPDYNDLFSAKRNKFLKLYTEISTSDVYTKYPYLCALYKLFYCEGNMVSVKGDIYPGDAMYDVFKEISDYYSHLKSDKNPIYSYVCENVNYHLSDFKNNVSILEQENKGIINQIAKISSEIQLVKETVYNNPYNSVNIQSDYYDAILNQYGKLITNQLRMGNYNVAYDMVNKDTSDFLKFYNKMPYDFPIQYRDGNQIKILNVKLYRNTAILLDAISRCMIYNSIKSQSTDEPMTGGKNSFRETTLEYADKTINYTPNTVDNPSSNIAPETIAPYYLTMFKDSAKKYKVDPIIESISFTKEEFVNCGSEVYLPTDWIFVRAQVKNTGTPLYSMTIKIHSEEQISNRFKYVLLTRENFKGGYYGKIQANNNDNVTDKTKNLIDGSHDIFNPSIACFTCDNKDNDSILSLYKNPYFKYTMGNSNTDETTFDVNTNNFKNKHFKNSLNFLKAAGVEYIVATHADLKTRALIKNQADWFIIDAHGRISDGTGGISDKNNSKITPKELLIENAYSDDLNVLIISACSCLKWIGDDTDSTTFSTGWHRVLPKGIILGYNEFVSLNLTKQINEKFNEQISQGFSGDTNEIVQKWVDANIVAYQEFINNPKNNYGTNAQKHYFKVTYIIGNEYNFIKKLDITSKYNFNNVKYVEIKADCSNPNHIEKYLFKR